MDANFLVNKEASRKFFNRQNFSDWVVVLVGADGLHHSAKEGNVINLPKQEGGFSRHAAVLDQAWGQARKIVAENRIITVACKTHTAFFNKMGRKHIPGKLIYQSEDHGSAVAIYLALAHIMAKDPHARVVVLPVDHGLHLEKRFIEVIQEAMLETEYHPMQTVLLGTAATSNKNVGRQWIETCTDEGNEGLGAGVLPVLGIYNKPRPTLAKHLLDQGSLRNTNILVARVKLLWELGRRFLPELFERMEYVNQVLQHFEEDHVGEEYIKMATSHAFYYLQDMDIFNDLIPRCLGYCSALSIDNMQRHRLMHAASL